MSIVTEILFETGIGELKIKSADGEDAAAVISFVKQVDSQTDFLMREAGEFNMTISEEKAFLENAREKERQVFLIAQINEVIVGTLGFSNGNCHRYRHKGQLGIAVSKDFWGYGIGVSMMKVLLSWADESGLVRISLEVDSTNERAISLYQKLGFEREGLLRYDRYMRNGKYRDSLIMSRINHQNLEG